MSGSLAVSNSFVSMSGWWRLCLPNDSFVSQSGWWCPAFRLAPIHLSLLVTLHLSPSLTGGVRLSGCLQFICFPLVAIHCCLLSPIHLSSLVAIDLSPIACRLWQFICFPVWLVASGFLPVSIQLGWWCPGLRLFPINLFPPVAMHLSPSLASGVRLLGCLQFIVSPCGNSFVSQSGWWCPALRLSPIHLSPYIPICLSPNLAGGVQLSGCLQFICFRLVAIHLSPSLAGGVRLSMLSAVSNLFVFPCGN